MAYLIHIPELFEGKWDKKAKDTYDILVNAEIVSEKVKAEDVPKKIRQIIKESRK